MANVVVRAAARADLAALQSLNEELQTLHFKQRPDQFKPVDSIGTARFLRELLQSPTTSVWVAELDAEIVGCAVVQRQERADSLFCPARVWWYIDQLAVAAAQRRTGVGRALVQHVVALARAQGITELELNTWAFNRTAQAAFRQLGFKPKHVRLELDLSRPATTT